MAEKPNEQELELLSLIDAEYTRHPFFGSRKLKYYLRGLGYTINRKRVQRLMGILGLAGMAVIKHDGQRMLCRVFRASITGLWKA